ncbi:MAG: flavodoxin domain-containing protein [Candidatus Cloacimonetes bacterium]|nr:flavodoxin domain-containing protein [Candidatus Cloacimonadota bacterium]
MNFAVIYMSKHGTTEKIAKIIRIELNNSNVKLFNLKKTKKIDLEQFDIIIIGGSIHAGSIQAKLRKFMKKNLISLSKKRIALFLVCMQKGEKCKLLFNNAFPTELREISIANGYLGGEFIFDNMNFIERALVKMISGETSNVNQIDNNAIENFINKITLLT